MKAICEICQNSFDDGWINTKDNTCLCDQCFDTIEEEKKEEFDLL